LSIKEIIDKTFILTNHFSYDTMLCGSVELVIIKKAWLTSISGSCSDW